MWLLNIQNGLKFPLRNKSTCVIINVINVVSILSRTQPLILTIFSLLILIGVPYPPESLCPPTISQERREPMEKILLTLLKWVIFFCIVMETMNISSFPWTPIPPQELDICNSIKERIVKEVYLIHLLDSRYSALPKLSHLICMESIWILQMRTLRFNISYLYKFTS